MKHFLAIVLTACAMVFLSAPAIAADTQPAGDQILQQYKSAGSIERQSIVNRNSSAGHYTTIANLALWELAEHNHGPALTAAQEFIPDVTSELLLAGGDKEADQLLHAVLVRGGPEDWRQQMIETFLWFADGQGSLKEERAWAEHGMEGADANWANTVRARLAYAQGDWQAAHDLAQQANNRTILNALDWRRGDYASMATRLEANLENPPKLGTLGVLADCYRLAGDQADLDQTINRIMECGQRTGEHITAGWILILLDRPDAALKFWLDVGHFDEGFNMLFAQHFFVEAYELVDQLPDERIERHGYLRLAAANGFYRYGRKQDALKQLDLAIDENHSIRDFDVATLLAQAEREMGQPDKACEVLLEALDWKHGNDEPSRQTLERVLGDQGVDWRRCWDFYAARDPSLSNAQKLDRVRKLAESKTTDGAKHLIESVDAVDGPGTSSSWGLPRWVAQRMWSANHAEAEKYLQSWVASPGGRQCLPLLADWAVQQKQWSRAADLYRQLWDRKPANIWYLAMRVWALSQAGRTSEARQAADLAHRIVRCSDRVTLYDALADHDLKDFAARERDTLLKLSLPGSLEVFEMGRHESEAALAAGDPALAAQWYDKCLLANCYLTVWLSDVSWYLYYPAQIHWFRARAAIKSGDADRAVAEVHDALRLYPVDDDVLIDIIRRLRKAGHSRDAESLAKEGFEFRQRPAGGPLTRPACRTPSHGSAAVAIINCRNPSTMPIARWRLLPTKAPIGTRSRSSSWRSTGRTKPSPRR